MDIDTTAIHAGHSIDPSTGAVTPPIHLSTTFEREADGSYPTGYAYSREANPNRRALEEAVAALEGGVAAAALSSGSAASMTLIQALAPGDHLLAPQDFYYGLRQLLQHVFIPWGLAVDFVDMTDLDAVRAAIRPQTRLVWLETPSNPLIQMADIAALAEIAHAGGAKLVVDNTIPTPILQRPFEHGADIIVHSTTKFMSGHSDVLGGLIVTRQEDALWQRVIAVQHLGGAVPSPFECWLALRGIQTLPLRVRTQAESALRIAHFLEEHPAVEVVRYPGLASHPQHAIAAKQMDGYGGLLSFQVKGGQAAAMAVAAKVQVFTRATSFGGTHSLIEHRASIEAVGTTTPDNLLRVSVGLESVRDLIGDLGQALG